jgi:hypothetical protein
MRYATETLSRDEAVDWLVADDIETIRQAIYRNDYAYLSDIVTYGRVGYNEMPLEELLQEVAQRSGGVDYE